MSRIFTKFQIRRLNIEKSWLERGDSYAPSKDGSAYTRLHPSNFSNKCRSHCVLVTN